MADAGQSDCDYDRRFRALVLLATFASLRWGEVTALTRADIDLEAGLVRVRVAFSDPRSPGSKITLGPVKSRAARRVVGIPEAIIPALREHLAIFVGPEPTALVFAGPKGAPLRRSNFNRASGWRCAAEAAGLGDVHFHDLRHTGNTFAAASGVGIKDLMARLGHDSERAAMIYQHEARGADKAITSAIDAHVEAEREREGGTDDRPGGMLVPGGNGTLMARGLAGASPDRPGRDGMGLSPGVLSGAGDGNRTRMTSLEGFGHKAADQPERRSAARPPARE